MTINSLVKAVEDLGSDIHIEVLDGAIRVRGNAYRVRGNLKLPIFCPITQVSHNVGKVPW